MKQRRSAPHRSYCGGSPAWVRPEELALDTWDSGVREDALQVLGNGGGANEASRVVWREA
jgi:hypothetical protein